MVQTAVHLREVWTCSDSEIGEKDEAGHFAGDCRLIIPAKVLLGQDVRGSDGMGNLSGVSQDLQQVSL